MATIQNPDFYKLGQTCFTWTKSAQMTRFSFNPNYYNPLLCLISISEPIIASSLKEYLVATHIMLISNQEL